MMLNPVVIDAMKSHYLFQKYWFSSDTESLQMPVLQFFPGEYAGYYQSVINVKMNYIGDCKELKDSVCKVAIKYTSIENSFDPELAVSCGDSPYARCSILIDAVVYLDENRCFSTSFLLGSKKEEDISGKPEWIRKILG